MTVESILNLYLLVFAIYIGFNLSLSWLNLSHAIAARGSVPDYFKDWITTEQFNKSIDYTVEKQRLGLVQDIYSALILLACILWGFFGYFDAWVANLVEHSYLQGSLFILLLSLLSTATQLPFSYYSQFSIEDRYGFNTMSIRLWLIDLCKSTFLQFLIGIPILIALFYLIDSLGTYWWLYAFIFIASVQLVLMFVYPILIAPIFNKFTVLEESSLKDRIFKLAEKAKFKTSGIFVMDGSTRSTHGNAYFTGFGKYKRIVLFDTLIDSLSESEVLAVLAHEIGHEKRMHIKKSILVSLALLLVCFWALSFLIDYQPLFQAFGFERVSYHGALLLFGFISEPFMFFIGPAFSVLSRRFEFEADRFAVDLVHGAKDLSSALLSLSKKSLSNLVPHPLYSFFHYSHPTLSERLPAMTDYAQLQGFLNE